ncbi:MAG: NAD-dependent epimerase/dehydratase family protein [Rubrivivax sp.]
MPAILNGKFVIVGGASLLGSHLAEQLLQGGARQVVLLDNLSLGSADSVQFLLADPRCTLLRGDMLRLNELYDAFAETDGVFAVAGFLTLPMAAQPWVGLDVNVRGMHNVLEASRYRGVKKVVFSSSVGLFGQLGDDNDDEDPFRWQKLQPPSILYGASKIIGEGLGRLYQQQHGLDFLALRYAMVYGERQHLRGVNALYMIEAYKRIRDGLPPLLPGDGSKTSDYIYAGDAARANVMAMESAATGEGMNIASGTAVSLNEVVALLLKICESDLKPEYRDDPAKVSFIAGKTVRYGRAKAKRLLGWEPQVPLEQGLRRLIRWVESNPGKF